METDGFWHYTSYGLAIANTIGAIVLAELIIFEFPYLGLFLLIFVITLIYNFRRYFKKTTADRPRLRWRRPPLIDSNHRMIKNGRGFLGLLVVDMNYELAKPTHARVGVKLLDKVKSKLTVK